MASRNIWCVRRNFLFDLRDWMLQYSAEVFLKSISFRPFSAECDSKDKESLEEEREDLLSNLVTMGVDIDMARRRQPGVFNKAVTNEQELKLFLLSKGASDKVIGSIISRYPRAITRTPESLSKRWDLWRKIMASDLEIVNILERSPESFFRSNNNLNLENNIKFLCSVGLTHKCLCRLLTNAPRTFSNSLNLNKQMVEFLQETGMSLGHNDPRDFVRKIISKNPSILIQSTKRVKTNIEFLQSTFNLNKRDLLLLICGPGARILDLSNDCTKKNYTNIRERLLSLGCSEEEVQRFVLSYLNMVFLSEKKFNDKIDCLIEEKISASQIIENPRILDSSINTLKTRIRELSHAGYDLSTSSIALLSWSQRRYEAKLKRLCG
ncbi:transcription termination factor 1a, mitochondrial precursor [Mus musculus]|uniref:Transcription termination factor 1a, mitochondrial n=2 Tax=Mus musculus TaxID=10090 RepID=MTF1A_MOUSE|nr:transcription termination factor 1a, mitochondrial precursor [Mus musculus]NP_742147.1 transcription termination factor 1a, mitochondrial precursor [Mus musculus]Q8CHZ9.1 RecName: Full=Transcription termination factor 1a, mitochondrial; AltName: Full=Mitochondrial transcription termination factor 1a; Short=mTERF1a; Flags: Precursor [Mus musculus]AAH38058.1 Mitochondrial transcription termination factor [Mus musculus]AAH51251.1 Mitochondrial transcription termination factor [Mus musculus]AAU|eukprot:NP_001013041.2 transcription termination factor 1a, mitochondrial precursor [Mus musculus]